MGIQGNRPPYLGSGTYYVYFSRSDTGPSGGAYNLTADQADVVIARLEADRQCPFDQLVGDMPGVGYAYRNEDITYVGERSPNGDTV